MGLGSFPDISLFDARQQALSNKQLLSKKIDPIDEKNRAQILRQHKIRNSPILLISISQKKRKMNGLILKANNNGEIQLLLTLLLFWI